MNVHRQYHQAKRLPEGLCCTVQTESIRITILWISVSCSYSQTLQGCKAFEDTRRQRGEIVAIQPPVSEERASGRTSFQQIASFNRIWRSPWTVQPNTSPAGNKIHGGVHPAGKRVEQRTSWSSSTTSHLNNAGKASRDSYGEVVIWTSGILETAVAAATCARTFSHK